VFAKGGRVIWVEFKATGEKLTDLQAEEHIEMQAAGLDVRWYDSIEAFMADFETIDAELDGEIAKHNGLDNPKRQAPTNPAVRRVEKSKRKMSRSAPSRQRIAALDREAGPFRELEELSSVEFEEWLLKS
jgi:hypothetical protein